jgi:2-polyprenyl-6-methoxyphenol hydroxylase-like FAD-dependent oxidoreductase
VKVTTADGAAYSGTILIGVDGIHSGVREEMFRIGNQLQPGYFPPGEQDRVPCSYRCLFGISQDVADYDVGELNYVRAKDYAQLHISGPNDRVYWFVFDKLPETKYGNEIPRYNKEDEAEFVKKFQNVPATKKLTFGDLYSKTISSTLTPIHEVVYEKWFFKRILIFGDSAHKVSSADHPKVPE